jgi:hypothetical protein
MRHGMRHGMRELNLTKIIVIDTVSLVI